MAPRFLSSEELKLKAEIKTWLEAHGYNTHKNTTFGWKEKYKTIMKEQGMVKNDKQGAAESILRHDAARRARARAPTSEIPSRRAARFLSHPKRPQRSIASSSRRDRLS